MTDVQVQLPNEKKFSVGAFIGGLALAFVIGGVGNIICGAIAMGMKVGFYGFLMGAIPGTVFILLGLAFRSAAPSLSKGMLIGGLIILLIGGACGASMVNTSFR